MKHIFPLLALTGLILAGWALIITPDEIRNGQEYAKWSLINPSPTAPQP